MQNTNLNCIKQKDRWVATKNYRIESWLNPKLWLKQQFKSQKSKKAIQKDIYSHDKPLIMDNWMIITTTAQKVQMYRFLSKMPISPKTKPQKCRRKWSWKIDSNSKASKLLSSLQFASCLDSTVTFSALTVDRPVLPRIYTLRTRYELFFIL